jgi:predicted nucleic acid-binding protein
MALKVLDSWALIAYFEDEPAAEQVEQLLVKAETGAHKLLLCAVNWGEIYYNTMREVSQEAAEQIAKEMAGLTIEIVGVGEKNLELVRQAAIFKATRKFSYADAFAAALAKIRNAELVTGDREFRQVEDEIKIAWLR